jgi:ribonuclease M5
MMPQRIEEIIVVEGRDDERAVKSAVIAETIATHGYGISERTWALIEKAYLGPGIIVFTDPDYAGETIRKRIEERFPNAKHAYLSREEATKGGDIGIENAAAESICEALQKVKYRKGSELNVFTMDDLLFFKLVGAEQAGIRRDKLGKSLGIGYGNTKTFLNRLNHYGITREEFFHHGQALFTDDHSTD